MISPSTCPLCNSPLSFSHSTLELVCNNSHYRFIPKEQIDYSIFIINSSKYRIYNNYFTSKSIIRAYYNHNNQIDMGQIILRFDFNIPINPNSLNRFLNLKAFLWPLQIAQLLNAGHHYSLDNRLCFYLSCTQHYYIFVYLSGFIQEKSYLKLNDSYRITFDSKFFKNLTYPITLLCSLL